MFKVPKRFLRESEENVEFSIFLNVFKSFWLKSLVVKYLTIFSLFNGCEISIKHPQLIIYH
jgi:hypothetical protein